MSIKISLTLVLNILIHITCHAMTPEPNCPDLIKEQLTLEGIHAQFHYWLIDQLKTEEDKILDQAIAIFKESLDNLASTLSQGNQNNQLIRETYTSNYNAQQNQYLNNIITIHTNNNSIASYLPTLGINRETEIESIKQTIETFKREQKALSITCYQSLQNDYKKIKNLQEAHTISNGYKKFFIDPFQKLEKVKLAWYNILYKIDETYEKELIEIHIKRFQKACPYENISNQLDTFEIIQYKKRKR